ncbi:GrpB family protein [Pseudokineococcus basanitobsidens]|uniref:GrpB family protein n=1 Tax=Pseudokineococcus basanitobsidens TaxID=1926649 RepID=A0ABU8RPE3_9ACTN
MSDQEGVEWFDRAGGEPVELAEASPHWRAIANTWIARINDALATATRVEHVGSTAVPGLVAKPVVDLQVSVPAVADEGRYRPGLESLGLVLRARGQDHLFFRPPAGQPRVIHVHVCEAGSSWERQHLYFRDQLRSRPDLAMDYARLKRDLALLVGDDRGAYNRGKAGFIRKVLCRDER